MNASVITKNAPSPKKLVAIFLVVIGVSSFIITAADRRPPVSVVDGKAITATLAPGQTFEGTWTVTVNRRCNVTTRRWLQSISEPNWEVPLPEINPGFKELPYAIPKTVQYPVTPFSLPSSSPEGDMTYNIEMTFVCWHWGDFAFPINVVFTPITFSVVRKQN